MGALSVVLAVGVSAGQRFGHWRRSRPFWAGVLLLGSGLAILTPPYTTLRLGDLALSIGTPDQHLPQTPR